MNKKNIIYDKVWKRKVLVLCVLFLFISLTACQKKNERSQTEDETQEQETSDETYIQENESYKNTIDTSQLHDDLQPTIVKVECGDLSGSGIIWSVTKDRIYVITNKHVLLDASTCDVTFWEGEYYTGKVAYLSGSHDVGLVVVDTAQIDASDLETMQAVVPCVKQQSEIQSGTPIVIFGSSEYIASDFIEAEVVVPEGYIVGTEDVMLIGQITREIDQGQNNQINEGMSGSGIFNEQGELIGILVSGDTTKGTFAVVPVELIMEDAQTWQYSDLLQE